ncbi:MAG: MFS transporter [Candidatus Brockarchaeota archaeon]|nr:MFS transporter [Candidatus Brockarchaeota archaeon]
MKSEEKASFSLKRSLLLLFAVNVGVAIVNSCVTPIWPLYLEGLGATVLEVSLVASMLNLVDTVLRTVTGLGSDVYGRRLFIAASSFLSSVSLFLYPFARSWQNLVPLAMVYAASFSFFMPARTAYVADCCPPKLRTKAYSAINASWPIGSILGPIVGGIASERFGWNCAFYVASAISAATILPAIALREPKRPRSGASPGIGNLRPAAPYFALNFLSGFGMGITSAIVPLYVQLAFDASLIEVGIFFSIGSGVAMLLAQLPASWFPTKYGRRKTLLMSQSTLPLAFFLWPFAGEYPSLLLIYMSINGFWSMTWPSILSLLMDAAEPERRGIVTGFAQTSMMLGFSVGPILGGLLWEGVGPAYPFYASAAVFAFSLPIILGLRPLKPKHARG